MWCNCFTPCSWKKSQNVSDDIGFLLQSTLATSACVSDTFYTVNHIVFLSTVAKLLQQHAANIDAERSDGMTAIHIAAQEGLTEVAEVLLEHKKSIINSKNKDHQTPLHLAARHKQGGVIELLLQRLANKLDK